jgi:MerR family transcriptional regulator/heat shock protein HspR
MQATSEVLWRFSVQSAEDDPNRGLFGITTAAELVGTGVQNLRLYEQRGLIEPERTEGGTRRYSTNDLERLRHIGALLADGLNLAGVSAVLTLEATNEELRDDIAAHERAAESKQKRGRRPQ